VLARLVLACALAASCGAQAQTHDEADEPMLSAAGVSGEILDLAIEECRRGEAPEAMALFRAMRAQLDPPPAILQLIRDLEATGCVRRQAANSTGLRVQLSGGWDSNVTQGTTARTLTIGSGPNAIELPLDQTYLPHASAFAQVAADYALVLPASGLNLQASVAHRSNTHASGFDLGTGSLSASREFRWGDRILRAQADVAEIWLGSSHYQRTRGGGVQWIWANRAGSWAASANIVDIDYLTQPAQNSRVHDVGLLFERRLDASLTLGTGGSVLFDKATNGRPGGDRTGFQLQASAVFTHGGWRYRPQVSYTRWDSAEVFAAGLIDVRRRNELWQTVVQAEKPLTPTSSLVIEWRGRWAQDRIVLYAYKAQMLTTTFVHRF
jgi:hypothetical protein